MYFYTIAPFKTNVKPLTYQSQKPLEKGDWVKITLLKRALKGVVLGECAEPDFACKDASPTQAYFNAHQMLLLEFIAHYYCCTPSMSASLFYPFLKSASASKYLQSTLKTNCLSSAQQEALDALKTRQSALLFGDTGSGKTQIYIHLIMETLQHDKTAIVLVPEIALTAQTQRMLMQTFKSQVGLWHSKLDLKQRQELLDKLHAKETRVVVGTRSALFLPMPNLGLMIIDEEHDYSYKSNQNPYYHARDVALYLSSKMPIQVILGSATPSLRSYYMSQKNQNLVRLKGRFFDSNREILFEEQRTTISPFLLSHLKETLNAHQQSVIFMPTRAHFKKLLCQTCGQGVCCPFCSVNMSLHLKDKQMRCHYCQHTEKIPSTCPTCQHNTLEGKRMGTQQLKKELEALLPQARIGILDKDHTHTSGQIQSILEAFNAQEIDILIGTQMVAKGHDYHNISLAIILGLDEVLHNGSYASFEQGVSLMHQIAGRSARKEHGKVLIQTLNDAFLQRYIQDYEDFLKEELRTRVPHFPPFVRLAQLEFSAPSAQSAKNAMQACLELLQPLLEQASGVEILGAGSARVAKVANKHRYEILLNATSTPNLIKTLHHLQEHAKGTFKIVMDPVDV